MRAQSQRAAGAEATRPSPQSLTHAHALLPVFASPHASSSVRLSSVTFTLIRSFRTACIATAAKSSSRRRVARSSGTAAARQRRGRPPRLRSCPPARRSPPSQRRACQGCGQRHEHRAGHARWRRRPTGHPAPPAAGSPRCRATRPWCARSQPQHALLGCRSACAAVQHARVADAQRTLGAAAPSRC